MSKAPPKAIGAAALTAPEALALACYIRGMRHDDKDLLSAFEALGMDSKDEQDEVAYVLPDLKGEINAIASASMRLEEFDADVLSRASDGELAALPDFYRRALDEGDKAEREAMAKRIRIQYPLTVDGIVFSEEPGGPGIPELPENWRSGHYRWGHDYVGPRWAAVRSCREEEPGTRLGLHLGDLPIGGSVRYEKETGFLKVKPGLPNPAFWVQSLNRVVYGAGSYWSKIDSPEALQEITDEDINSTFYNQALRDLETRTTVGVD